jgi:hypothetical protein
VATIAITEDEVKMAVRDHFVSQGYVVAVAWDLISIDCADGVGLDQ